MPPNTREVSRHTEHNFGFVASRGPSSVVKWEGAINAFVKYSSNPVLASTPVRVNTCRCRVLQPHYTASVPCQHMQV